MTPTRYRPPVGIKFGDRVKVYRNLHLGRDVGVKFYSVVKNGLVVTHVSSIMLKDVKFVVQPAGREKVRRTGRKNVHAFVVGTVTPSGMGTDKLGVLPIKVTYNPRTDDKFKSGDLWWVTGADVAVVNQSGVTAAYAYFERRA